MLEKLMEVHSLSQIREAATIVRKLIAAGVNPAELAGYGAVAVDKIKKVAEERVSTIRGRRAARKEARGKRRRDKPAPPSPYLKPGDSEPLSGVKCEKCGESFVYEALCGAGAQKHGCIRIGICTGCNAEIKIK